MKAAIVGPKEGREELRSYLLRFGKSVCADMELVCSDRLGDLPNQQWNLAFIYPYDEDIEALQSFQSAHPSCEIVLWADDEKWAIHGLHLHTASFIVMPVSEEQFAQSMQQCKASWMNGMKTVKGYSDGEQHRVHCADILYAEADGHHILIYTKTQQLSVNMSLTAFAAYLGDGFVRCHRCFIANIRSIQDILPEKVLLFDGRKIPLGSGKTATEAEEIIHAFRREMGAFI